MNISDEAVKKIRGLIIFAAIIIACFYVNFNFYIHLLYLIYDKITLKVYKQIFHPQCINL